MCRGAALSRPRGRSARASRRHMNCKITPDAKLRDRRAREPTMTRADLTEKILDIKREKGWTWKHICEQIGGMSPMLITGALLGQMKLTKPQAAKAAELFGLG